MKKIKLVAGILLILALFKLMFGPSDSETTTESSQRSTQSSTTKQSSTTTETDQSSEKVSYDVAEMNTKITESFNESVQFNQEGHDGYEWSAYIYEIKLKDNGAINAIVNDNFSTLSDTDKTEVLNSVSRAVNMVVFLKTGEDKSYFITAYDQSGNKVAQSHMFDVLKYDFE
ncbi:hypothetical protein ACQRDX_04900 [Streptococcus sp. SGI.013]|uniref:hypothetical protein n=1 Tax=unclassified Streptococcus TaxID=2608887 RepID=UPI003D06F64A